MEADSRKPNFRSPYTLLLCLIAAVGIVFRFVKLESVPPGVFVDEQAGMANALCLLRNGTSIYGKPWPIYFQGLGGFYDPIFIYSQVVFAEIFGASIAAFRIFPSLCLLSACFGTAALAWTFLGLDGALLALVMSLFCPWSFHAGRLVWGSGLITGFIPWGLFCLWRTKFGGEKGKAPYLWAVLGGLFLSCAASLYRPADAVVVLLLAFLFVFRAPGIAIRFRYLLAAVATLIICGIPNFWFLASSGWNRVDSLSILGKEHMAKLNGSFADAVSEIIANYRKLLSWDFLFISGDTIYRHTPAWGALGWPECLGLAVLLLALLLEMNPRKKRTLFHRRELAFVIFCIGAIFIGLFPAAQSWDSNPHALRANAAWPFFVLLSSVGIVKLFRHFSLGPIVVSFVFLIYAPIFLSHYFLAFPALAEPWFDVGLTKAAKYAEVSGDWRKFGEAVKDYGRDGPPVFPMMYKGLDCLTGQEFVESLRPHPAGPPPRITIEFGKPAPLAPYGQSISPVPAP